jgi:hypothetical protein
MLSKPRVAIKQPCANPARFDQYAAEIASNNSITGKSPQRVFGHETVTAGIAGPQIADDVVGKISGGFRGYHGVRANRTGR